MNIKGIIGAGLIAGASLLATSCYYSKEAKQAYNNRKALLENVMQDRPQKELDSLRATFAKGAEAEAVQSQHAADSIAFSNMFKGTEKAKDSTFVAEYNKMMAKTKTPLTTATLDATEKTGDYKKLNKQLADVLTVKEMKKIEKNPVLPENGGKGFFHTGRQFLVDSVYHHKLFEKYGLLDNNGMKTFKKICNKVRP